MFRLALSGRVAMATAESTVCELTTEFSYNSVCVCVCVQPVCVCNLCVCATCVCVQPVCVCVQPVCATCVCNLCVCKCLRVCAVIVSSEKNCTLQPRMVALRSRVVGFAGTSLARSPRARQPVCLCVGASEGAPAMFTNYGRECMHPSCQRQPFITPAPVWCTGGIGRQGVIR